MLVVVCIVNTPRRRLATGRDSDDLRLPKRLMRSSHLCGLDENRVVDADTNRRTKRTHQKREPRRLATHLRCLDPLDLQDKPGRETFWRLLSGRGRLDTHVCRHTFATRWLRDGGRMDTLAKDRS